MKRILIPLFLVVCLLGVSVFYILKNIDMRSYRKTGPLLAFGDSLTEGYGTAHDNNYVVSLENRIGEPIINAGVGGATTYSALDRLEQDVLLHKPRIVIILLGANDMIQEKPLDETFDNLSRIIDLIRKDHARVLLLGIEEGPNSYEYKVRFDALAEGKKVAYVPDILRGIMGNTEYMYDQIHPNDGGYEKMAERIEPELEKMLGK
ncbi:MAG: GDSL-type esterase/lipase family protein [Candidatus Roizmanbacteria bacterium]|nr:GDSL-type esterase/lipase family protein [Candidatus Roizmanbacteria bacterium]